MKIQLKGSSLIWCAFFLKAFATTVADKNLSLWNTFEWELSLQRSKQDEFVLKGFLDDEQAKLQFKIPAATCNQTEVFRELPHKRKNGFLMHCRCDLQSSSFIPEFKQCVANSYIKQGCRYTTGSWRWPRWTWDKVNDSLIVMDKDGYGIATAFNATTRQYTKCSVQSISYWEKNMEWIAMGMVNGSKISFFKLKEFWHMSWNIEQLNAEVKKGIEGKVLKFMIKCENEEEDEDVTLSSCLVFKVFGELQFISTFIDTSTSPPTTAATTDAGSEESNTVIILAATLSFVALVIIIIIFVFCCVRKRRGQSFAVANNESTEANVTMTQLLSENPDETVA